MSPADSGAGADPLAASLSWRNTGLSFGVYDDVTARLTADATDIVRLNSAALDAMTTSRFTQPAVIARSLYLVHTALYETWRAANPDEPAVPGFNIEVDEAELDEAALRSELILAAATVLDELAVDSAKFRLRAVAEAAGVDLNQVANDQAAESVGVSVARQVLDQRADDGSNSRLGYLPVGLDLSNLYTGDGLSRWQPLELPTGARVVDSVNAQPTPRVDASDPGSAQKQAYQVPHWGEVATASPEPEGRYLLPVPPPARRDSSTHQQPRGHPDIGRRVPS